MRNALLTLALVMGAAAALAADQPTSASKPATKPAEAKSGPGAKFTGPFFSTGWGGTDWLVFQDGPAFRVAVKAEPESWKMLPEQRQGTVAAVGAARQCLTVFFADGGNVQYFVGSEALRGAKPPAAIWPFEPRPGGILRPGDTVILDACGDGERGDSLYVLISRPRGRRASSQPAATAAAPNSSTTGASYPSIGPASRPSTPVAPGYSTGRQAGGRPTSTPFIYGLNANLPTFPRELALLRYGNARWEELSVVPAELAPQCLGGRLAAKGGSVYALLEVPHGRVLLTCENQQWRRLPAPEPLSGQPLAMLGLHDLTLAQYGVPSPSAVAISRYYDQQWHEPEPVMTLGGTLMLWDKPPAVASLADRVAFAWRDESGWYFATAGPENTISPRPLEAFGPGSDIEAFERMERTFLLVLLGVILLLMFWPTRTIHTGPFALPGGLVPASPGKRLLAFLIDSIPFNLLTFSYVTNAIPADMNFEQMWEYIKTLQTTEKYLFSYFTFLVSFASYGIIMESLFGATLGKMLLRMRVVGDQGQPPDFRGIALRNVSKIAEMLALWIPMIYVFFNRYRQRLGERLAWTTVIDLNKSTLPKQPPPHQEYPPEDFGDDV